MEDRSYTLNFYREGEATAFDTQEVTVSTWVGATNVAVNPTTVNGYVASYEPANYEFVRYEMAGSTVSLPTTIANGGEIDVIYAQEMEDRSYTLNFYKEGDTTLLATQEVTVSTWVGATGVAVNPTTVNGYVTTHTPTNYLFSRYEIDNATVALPTSVDNGEDINVYYAQDPAKTLVLNALGYTGMYDGYSHDTLLQSSINVTDALTTPTNLNNITYTLEWSDSVDGTYEEVTFSTFNQDGSIDVAGTLPLIKNFGTDTIYVRVKANGYNTSDAIEVRSQVSKAELLLTANSLRMPYGATAVPSLSYSISGYMPGDSASNVTITNEGKITLSTTFNPVTLQTRSAGTYPVTITLPTGADEATAENYTLRAVNGAITVTKATLTLSPDAIADILYGDSLAQGILTYSAVAGELKYGETLDEALEGEENISVTTDYDTTDATKRNVGTYNILLDVPATVTSTNYDIVTGTNKTFEVDQATLVVRPVRQLLIYTQRYTGIEYTASGYQYQSEDHAWLRGILGTDVFEIQDVNGAVIPVNTLLSTGRYNILKTANAPTSTDFNGVKGNYKVEYEITSNEIVEVLENEEGAYINAQPYVGIYDGLDHGIFETLGVSFVDTEGEVFIPNADEFYFEFSTDGGASWIGPDFDGQAVEDYMPTVRNVRDTKAVQVKMIAKNFGEVIVSHGFDPDTEEEFELVAEVLQRSAAITVNGGYTKTAGAADPVFTATVSGTVAGESLNYILVRTPGETVGTVYPVNVHVNGSSVHDNYSITPYHGSITITAAIPVIIEEEDTPLDDTPDDEEVVIEEDETPFDDGEDVIIDEQDVPFSSGASWALINLLLAIFTALISLALIITYFKGKDDEEWDMDEAERKRKGQFRILSAVIAIIAIITFILTEDMSNPMVLIDRWTILMAIYTAIQLIVARLAKKEVEIEEEIQE